MKTIQAKIESLITATKKPGDVFTSSEFLNVEQRNALDKAFSRLADKGTIRRLAPGLYDIPKMGKFVNRILPPNPELIAEAWAKKNKAKILPNGVFAANALGLSDQMSGQYIYLTDKASKDLNILNTSIRFRRTSPRYMATAGKITGVVIQALRSLGRIALENDQKYSKFVTKRLKVRLSQEEKRQLRKDWDNIPVWMRPILNDVTFEEISITH
ncbi:MAG: DUF6088 family protein [Akkermansia sp.]